MKTYKEKLSILSEMISFAKVNGQVKSPEHDFLVQVARQLGVEKEAFERLFEIKADHIVPKTEADRILQFHRLVLLMSVDQINEEFEVGRLHTIGLHMGLPPSAINQVLAVMHKHPNGVVPPDVLITIFKTHYN